MEGLGLLTDKIYSTHPVNRIRTATSTLRDSVINLHNKFLMYSSKPIYVKCKICTFKCKLSN